MDATTFTQWKEYSAQSYAKDKVASGQWPAEGALERVHADMAQQLPDGLETPGHTIRHLVAGEERVGYVWWFERDRPGGRVGYIFDIEIDEVHRRRGYGRRALDALVLDVGQRGVTRLDLHVFAENTGAIRLYESAGYQITGVNMSLELS